MEASMRLLVIERANDYQNILPWNTPLSIAASFAIVFEGNNDIWIKIMGFNKR